MSVYEGEKRGVIVDCELSEEFEVKLLMNQGSMLSPVLFSVEIDVVTELVKRVC